MAEDNRQPEDAAPTNTASLLKQIEAGLAKKKLESIKGKLTELYTKIDEHKRSIRQLEGEAAELLTKHEAGIL